MLDQTFSPKSLLRLVRHEDVPRYRMWHNRVERDALIQAIANSLTNPQYVFPTLREKKMKGKNVYSAPDSTTMLALRKLDFNLRAIYKVKQSNRDDLVSQVKSLLHEGCAFTVLRLDIRSFYESINIVRIMEQLEQDSILSFTSRHLLRKLIEIPQLSQHGLPRGLGVSATLAELYCRDFDRHIRSLRHVYFYGRYVDDMIIFTHSSHEEVEHDVEESLNQIGLFLNHKKRAVTVCLSERKPPDQQYAEGFDFLGYHFVPQRYLSKKGEWRDVSIRIAQSKIKKIKSRIVHALVDFTSSADFACLRRRMHFLAGNYFIRGTQNRGLCGGLYYNYHHITDTRDLEDLDSFFHRLLFAQKGSIGTRLHGILIDAQREELLRIGFKAAFKQRFTQHLQWGVIKELARCWAYENN